jgi:hypothetical protein
MDQQFTVLIGSCARGTGDAYSDIDVVRVGHVRPLKNAKRKTLANSDGPVSYIDYDVASFESLYGAGSLFLHHIFTEGKLLDGNPSQWTELAEGFSVTKDLRNEIREQLGLCTWLAQPEGFANATMPLLSHLFRALKNAAIFSLAQRGVYVYDKREALRQGWPFLTNNDIELLVAANNMYVRGVPQLTSLPEAANSLPDLCSRVNIAIGDLLRNGNQKNSHRYRKGHQRPRELQLRGRKKPASRRL